MDNLSKKLAFEGELLKLCTQNEHLSNQFPNPLEFINLFSDLADRNSIPNFPVSPDNANIDGNTLLKVQVAYKEIFGE